ncbi:hypothetical protein CRYUN_Cryun31cG0050000 [Craigia yunnanensis]
MCWRALNVDIFAHGHVREKPVGSARVLLCDVLQGGDASEPVDNPIQCLTKQVWRSSGKPQSCLTCGFRDGEVFDEEGVFVV